MLPVTQRLELYGFAWVQVDPTRPIEPWRWGLGDLQKGHAGENWEFLFKNCKPFNPVSSLPVISPSLPWLKNLRAENPLRPLLFCQTAFESWPRLGHVKALPIRETFPFLNRDDAWRPLQWASLPEAHPQLVLDEYEQKHPREQLFQLLLEANPEGTQWFQEDGRIAIQQSLFGTTTALFNWQKLANTEALQQEVTDVLRTLSGSWLVCAMKRERWRYFSQDLCRHRRGQYFLREELVAPYKEMRGPLLVFAEHSSLRWGDLRCKGWPVIHLDGKSLEHHYRVLRVGESRMPSWNWDEPVRGSAHWVLGRKTFTFQLTDSGWRSPVTSEALPSAEGLLRELLDCFSLRKLPKTKSRLR